MRFFFLVTIAPVSIEARLALFSSSQKEICDFFAYHFNYTAGTVV